MPAVLELPILFRREMVRAINGDEKFETRRLDQAWLRCVKGSLLWVRETHWVNPQYPGSVIWDEDRRRPTILELKEGGWKIKPCIHQFKKDARIWLRATADARLERLQLMDSDDACYEGITWVSDAPGVNVTGQGWGLPHWKPEDLKKTPLEAFKALWDGIHAKDGFHWDSDPAVVVVPFEKCQPPQGVK